MKKLYSSYGLASLVLVAGIAVSLSIFSYTTYGQTTASPDASNGPALHGITFPIQGLGNCSNENGCRAYCNDSSHLQACITFAESHGLINKSDAQREQTFARVLQSSGGPGGCASPDQCLAYCSDLTHIDACISFAKTHGIDNDHVAQGERISAYIKAGGKMPGGCTSQDSCQAYCGDFSHAEECYQFAKSAGIAQASSQTQTSAIGANTEQNPTPDQLQKLSQLAQSGQTPGGCKTKDDCQIYCGDFSHLNECLAFGVKAGFMTQAQADMIKKTGNEGPGGCNSPQSCQTYCNDSSHQQDCFKFAENHGFLNKNDQQQIQNGVVQIRSGLEQAPPEVVACIKSTLNSTILDQIESGQLIPGPDVANQMRSCFDKFGHTENPGEIFNRLPDKALSCVKDKLGSDFDKIQSGAKTPTPEMADTVRVCFQDMRMQQTGSNGEQPQSNEKQNFQDFLQTAPPEIAGCLLQTLGDDFNKLKSGEKQPGPDILQKVQLCFSNFHPKPQSENIMPRPYQGSSTPPIPQCPLGQYWNGNLCVGTQSSTNNFLAHPPLFTQSSGTPSQPCPSGQYWNGLSCVTQTTADPAIICTQSGGTWTGTTCQIQATQPPHY